MQVSFPQTPKKKSLKTNTNELEQHNQKAPTKHPVFTQTDFNFSLHKMEKNMLKHFNWNWP